MILNTMFKNLQKINFNSFSQKLYIKIYYTIVVYRANFLWVLFKPIFKIFEKQSEYLAPSKTYPIKAYFLISPHDTIPRGINLTLSLKTFLVENSLVTELVEISDIANIEDIGLANKKIVVVMTAEALRYRVLEKNFLFILKESLLLRKKNIKVWAMPEDPARLKHALVDSIYVSIAGGVVIFSANTYEHLKKLGIPHPFGPIFWTMPSSIAQKFYSGTPISERKKICALAYSGGKKRIRYMEKIEPLIKDVGYEVVKTDLQLTWDRYVHLVKSTQIIITTSWLQKDYLSGNWLFRIKMPKTILTHRVLEGFAAGCVVVTTHDETLKSLGFIPQIHYIELDQKPSIKPLISAIGENKLDEIALSGQKYFYNLINSNFKI